MYIKFCQSYNAEKEKEKGEAGSKLAVELAGEEEKTTDQKLWLYRTACLVLALLSFILLLVVILLSVKCSSPEDVRECVVQQCLNERQRVEPLACPYCPSGWLSSGKSCFFFSKFRLSWEKSQDNCSSMGARLAVVDTPEIQNYLTQSGQQLMYWIGLRLNGTTWTWTDNTVLRKSYWEDTDEEGDCTLLFGQRNGNNWHRNICKIYSYYICHLQLA